jgi:hypothetical protein
VPRPGTRARRALPAPARAALPPYVLLPVVASPSVPPCSKAENSAYKTPEPPPLAQERHGHALVRSATAPWPRASAVHHSSFCSPKLSDIQSLAAIYAKSVEKKL